MTNKSVQENNFISGKHPKDKPTSHKRRMPTAKCICGAEILVLPDLKAMNKAIKIM